MARDYKVYTGMSTSGMKEALAGLFYALNVAGGASMATVLNLKAPGSKASQYPSLEFWADLTRGEDTLSSFAGVLILTQECYGLEEIKEAEEEYDQEEVLHGFAGETEFDKPYEPAIAD